LARESTGEEVNMEEKKRDFSLIFDVFFIVFYSWAGSALFAVAGLALFGGFSRLF
jgi:hypothetical protein